MAINQDDFWYRVSFAWSCIKTKRTNQRAFDDCFENNDGDYIVTALVRHITAIGEWENLQNWWGRSPCPWPATAAKYAHLTDDELAAAAVEVRKAAKAKLDAAYALYQARMKATA